MATKEDAEVADGDEYYDRANTTRWLALAGLASSWILGIICVILGTGLLIKPTKSYATVHRSDTDTDEIFHNWPQLALSTTAAEAVPLAAGLINTLLVESMGLIHSTTLRWTLGDKMYFSSNLRLFTTVGKWFCFSAVCNVLYGIFIIVSYAAISLMLPSLPGKSFCKHNSAKLGSYDLARGCGNDVVLSTPALCCLGVALLGQAGIVTWQLASSVVPTWSANPLDVAWARVLRGVQIRISGRCMMSVHDAALAPASQQPKSHQGSIWEAHKEARRIMYYIWTVTGLCYAWFLAIQITLLVQQHTIPSCNACNAYLGTNWNLFPDTGSRTTSTFVIPENAPSLYPAMFVLVCALQGFFTLALHCAELISTLSRDEATWRQCYSTKVYNPRPNALLRAATSWTGITLFTLKFVLHWLFGKAITYQYNWGIFMRPPQLLYLCFGATILAGVTSFLSFRRPNGEQPATFGHIQTLVDLVDEWHIVLFWGDKGLNQPVGIEATRHAGTSEKPMERTLVDALYE
jgi:hypothetical protein